MPRFDARQQANLAFGVGALGLVAVLGPLRFLPFQDIPLHAQLLALARTIGPGQSNAYFRHPDVQVLGYSLYVWIDRLLAPLLSADGSLRVMTLGPALALPLAVGRLARSAGADAALARLLALPLALSWSTRMGFVPFNLALPAALAAAAAALELARRPSWGRLGELALWLSLAWLGHPMGFLLAALLTTLAWLLVGLRTPMAAAAMVAAAVPAALMAIHDVAVDGFGRIPGTEVVWRLSPFTLRVASDAIAHLITRSYGITGFAPLAAIGPLVLLLGVCLVLARAEHAPDAEARRSRRYLAVAGLLGTAGTFLLPSSTGFSGYLAERVPALGVALLTALAAAAALPRRRWLVPTAALCALGATAFAVGEVHAQGRHVAALLGDHAPHSLHGSYLVARMNECAPHDPDSAWGVYDPEDHLWAYLLADDAFVPYLFAHSRYHPIWVRGDRMARELAAPTDWVVLDRLWPRRQCASNNLLRALWTLRLPQFDGVIFQGLDERMGRAVRTAPGIALRDVTPGLKLAIHHEERARLDAAP
jgi:hypothetical protein